MSKYTIDGDTFITEDGERIRLSGVDAPETLKVVAGELTEPGQAGAFESRNILNEVIAENPDAQVEPTGDESYNRIVADIKTKDGEDVGAYLNSVAATRPTFFSNKEQLDAEGIANMRMLGIGREFDDKEELAHFDRMNKALREPSLSKFDPYGGSKAISGGHNAFTGGVARGVDTTQAMLYAASDAVGDITGFDSMSEWGEEGMVSNMMEAAANPAKIDSLDDVDSLSQVGTFVAETIGEQLPNIALMATGAGAGAVAARAAIGKALLRNAAKARMLSKIPASGVGAFGASYPLGVGEVQMELHEAGIEAPGTALLAGIPIAALDAVGFEVMLGSLFRGVSNEAAKNLLDANAKELLKRAGVNVAKRAGMGAAFEMPTEVAQELIAMSARHLHDPEFEIFSDENIERLKLVAAKAGTVGGVFGGAGGTLQTGLEVYNAHKNAGDTFKLTPDDGTDPVAAESFDLEQEDVAPQGEQFEFNFDDTQETGSSNTAQQQAFDFDQNSSETEIGSTAGSEQIATPSEGIPTPEIAAETASQEEQISTETENVQNVTKDNVHQLELTSEQVDELLAGRLEEEGRIDIGENVSTVVHAPNKVLDHEEGADVSDGWPTRTAAEKKAKLQQALFPGSRISVERTTDGKGKPRFYVKEIIPQQDKSAEVEGVPARVRKALTGIFNSKQSDKASDRMSFTHPDFPSNKDMRATPTDITALGRELSEKSGQGEAMAARDNFLAGVAYLLDKGFKVKEQGIGSMNDNTVIYKGKGVSLTLKDAANVSKRISEISEEIDAREQSILDEYGSDKPNERFIDTERNKVNDLKYKLSAYGIDSIDATEAKVAGDAKQASAETVKSEVEDAKDEKATVKIKDHGKTDEYIERNETEEGKDNDYLISETDADQAKASAQDVIPNKREYKSQLDTFMRIAHGVLQDLGINIQPNFYNEVTAPDIIKALREKGENHLADRMQETIDANKQGRIHVDEDGEVYIFLRALRTDGKVDGADYIHVLTHELGHLIQMSVYDNAKHEVKDALLGAYDHSGSKLPFDEWFAEQAHTWAITNRAPKSIIEKFWDGVVKQLRKAWNKIRKTIRDDHPEYQLTETFKDFMNGIRQSAKAKREERYTPPKSDLGKSVFAQMQSTEFSGRLPTGNYEAADFTTVEELKNAAGKVASKARAKQIAKSGKTVGDFMDNFGDTVKALHKAVLSTADARMRNLSKNATSEEAKSFFQMIADELHTKSGKARDADSKTINQEIMQLNGFFNKSLENIGAKLKALAPKGRKILHVDLSSIDRENADYKRITDILIEEEISGKELRQLAKTAKNDNDRQVYEIAADVREYFDSLYKRLTDMGMSIEEVENYFPHVFDPQKILDNPEKFIELARKHHPKLSQFEAESLIRFITENQGTVMVNDSELTSHDAFASFFSGMKGRNFTKEARSDLRDFYQDDLAHVIATYTHQSIKRAVWQTRFGKQISDKHFDPMGRINEQTQKLQSEGKMTQEEYNEFEKVLNAHLGRLGATMDPNLRKMSSLAIMYQNIRVLGFVLLASIMDFGLLGARSGSLVEPLKQVRGIMNGKERAELTDLAKFIGSVRDDITEHILNDVEMSYFSQFSQNVNETFFKAVGMHQWTNLMRVMAVRLFHDMAIKNDAKFNKELGLKAADIELLKRDDWKTAIRDNDNIIAAMHKFSDEAVLRPNAALRPVWGSDARFAVIWHLKQFMWQYHAQVLGRTWQQAQDNPGLMKAMPFVLLAAATFPLAAAGYELRREIAYLGSEPPKDTDAYLWEVVQRSGMLGLMQLYVDANEAEEFGQFSMFALAGPTVGQFGEFLQKDFSTAASRAVPVLSMFPGVRQSIAN